jgi:hypothetical protein
MKDHDSFIHSLSTVPPCLVYAHTNLGLYIDASETTVNETRLHWAVLFLPEMTRLGVQREQLQIHRTGQSKRHLHKTSA